MAIIGVYDWDYFHFRNAIPNLECGKLLAYYKKNKDITMLTSELMPASYTKFFIRKDYDDGVFSNILFEPNVEYGGCAFTGGPYVPLSETIEKTKADFSDYLQFESFFKTQNRKDKYIINRILKAEHLRLSNDGSTVNSYINKNILDEKSSGIIFHDLNLGTVIGAIEKIKELSYTRYTRDGKEKPYLIGNKYPIQIYTEKEFNEWTSLPIMPDLFSLQYNGIIDKSSLQKIPNLCTRVSSQILNNPTFGFKDEEDFLKNGALQNFYQVLFLCTHQIKMPLKYDKNFIKSKEMQNYFLLMNCYIQKYSFSKYTPCLFRYCKETSNSASEFFEDGTYIQTLTPSQKREVFQYMRINNYKLFDAFYQYDGDNCKEVII